MDEIRISLSEDAERAYGAERAARLRGSLERLALALAAVRAYPLDAGVEPATLPNLTGPTAPERGERV